MPITGSRRFPAHFLGAGNYHYNGWCLKNGLIIMGIIAYVCLKRDKQKYLTHHSPFSRYPGTSVESASEPQDRTTENARLYPFSQLERRFPDDRLDSTGFAPGTPEVQTWIGAKQFPDSCTGKKIFVLGGKHFKENGVGSCIHLITAALGIALEHDGILVYDEECGGQFSDSGTNFDEFFKPISSCTYKDATTNGNISTIMAFSRMEQVVPTFAKATLQKHHPGISKSAVKYWWRAQGAAFVMRLNEKTSETVRSLRSSKIHVMTTGGTESPAPYPLPGGTISLHVRHGDKSKEMTLIPFDQYVKAAEKLAKENPLYYKHTIFVSTEDPDVIFNASLLGHITGTSPENQWTVFYSKIQRLNSGPMEQVNEFGASKMFIMWLTQLFLAMECDAFVGTRGSNWNRLIDELRCTMVPKCSNPYIEVGYPESWTGYSW
mmetsp:Transcript_12401/g.24936  ORF Transcript_12401/g.24936 Transcript_12401/m.24936 type:complete len:434 (-) Transcript_12401:1725-3026(-)